MMKRVIRILAGVLTGMVGAFACTAPADVIFVEEIEHRVLDISLALSVGRVEMPGTRMTDVVVQNTGETSFRGIEQVYAIPFLVDGKIQAEDGRFGANLELPQQGLPANVFGNDAQGGAFAGLVRNNNAHLYNSVFMQEGIRSMLVYGKAIDQNISVQTDSVAFKAGNGVLWGRGLDEGATAGTIHFDLEPISDGVDVGTELEALLGYLNGIAQTSVTYESEVYRWMDYANYTIQDDFTSAFRWFISERRPFAGSSVALGQILTRLYRSIYSIQLNTTGAQKALATAILGKINDTQFVTLTGSGSEATVSLKSDFPARYGIPAGTITLQWNGTAFWRPTRGAGSQAVTLTSFCYPPSLWYYANSRLAVSQEETVADEYTYTHATWADITSLYSSSSLVSGGVQSVAVRDPLQYGVALLAVYVNRVTKEKLLDSKGNQVSVANINFPMTGIIVSEQRNLSFDFTPRGNDVYYVYDQEVNDGTTPKNYISSVTSTNQGVIVRKDVQVLTTQTLPEEDLHLALEFQNNSGNTFYGHDGDAIVAGSRFYLFAKLKYSAAQNSTGENIDCILLQDHLTRVTFDVESLEEAYSTIPELRDPQLQVGVKANLEWILSTPTTIVVK
jgi:hypothetical protein